MRVVKLSGKDYHNGKLEWKSALKENSFKWAGSLDNPQWVKMGGKVVAEFVRDADNTTTVEAIFRIEHSDPEIEDALVGVLKKLGGEEDGEGGVSLSSTEDATIQPSLVEVDISATKYFVWSFTRSMCLDNGCMIDKTKVILFMSFNRCMGSPRLLYKIIQQAVEEGLLKEHFTTDYTVITIVDRVDKPTSVEYCSTELSRLRRDDEEQLKVDYPTGDKHAIMAKCITLINERDAERKAYRKEILKLEKVKKSIQVVEPRMRLKPISGGKSLGNF